MSGDATMTFIPQCREGDKWVNMSAGKNDPDDARRVIEETDRGYRMFRLPDRPRQWRIVRRTTSGCRVVNTVIFRRTLDPETGNVSWRWGQDEKGS